MKDDEALLLDSVILIDHLNGHTPATEFLAAAAVRCSVSAITRAEVLAGYDIDEDTRIVELLDRFPVLPVDRDAADLAGRLRRKHRWRLPDALQAAIARLHGLRLVTRNTRDFPPRRHRFVLVPYRLAGEG